MKRIGIFLIVVALIAGMVGCGGPRYDLTIDSTVGGSVTTPGEGTFTYDAGIVVNLNATPDAGYQFTVWTGGVGSIATANAPATTITMNRNYAITANFYKQEIQNWYDLDAIRNKLNGNYSLVNNLDSTTIGYEELASPAANEGKGWQPIGTHDDPFTGSFDGQGYEIRDLFINRPDEGQVGLFGRGAKFEGVIEHVGVVNATVTGGGNVGLLLGRNSGYNVGNSYSGGSVTGNGNVGGLVGRNEGDVSNSYSTSSVSGGYDNIGGLVGVNSMWGNVNDSYSSGTVSGDSAVGGLVGNNFYGSVSNSYSTGNVTGSLRVGGLVGYSRGGTVSNSYSTGSVTGNSSTGGLAGFSYESTVNNSFWDTETSGQASSDGGTGKTTAEMQDIITFSGASWNIAAVANPSLRNLSYIWNIVNNVTYPFLSWEP